MINIMLIIYIFFLNKEKRKLSSLSTYLIVDFLIRPFSVLWPETNQKWRDLGSDPFSPITALVPNQLGLTPLSLSLSLSLSECAEISTPTVVSSASR